jgi:V/A-type H+-transporting ATPase subunit I
MIRGFAYLSGFCPHDCTEDIKALAYKEGWAVLFQQPQEAAEVPTLLRNPRWVEIIRPIFKFMAIIPGYNEYDISTWFLIFFTIFFAMLIGDAGYGLIFLIITFILHKKVKKIPQEPIFLMYTLSTFTIGWGAVTGTWFGAEGIANLPLISHLVIKRVDSFIDTNHSFMMYICFFIGAIHLSIAHAVAAFRYMNRPVCLSQIGWIGIIWGVFFLAGKLVLGKPMPSAAFFLIIAGLVLAVLFSYPQKNIFKGMLIALGELPLKVVSSFSDIVSYLRLFAVGYATVMMSTTFNNMAIGSGINSVVNGFLAALILFLGHFLNVILGCMAVIVHGIRLNLLEFSSHLNMEWSGREYKPFKE